MSGSRSPAAVHTPRYLRASTRRSSAADDLTRRHRSDGLAAPRRGARAAVVPSEIVVPAAPAPSHPRDRRAGRPSPHTRHRNGRLLRPLFTPREISGLASPGTIGRSSQPPVEPAECVGEQDRNDQYARPEDKDVPGLAQFEGPDPAHKQIADSKVAEAP